jgi:hypothetical protein
VTFVTVHGDHGDRMGAPCGKTRAGLVRFRLAADPPGEKSNHEVARLRTEGSREAALPKISCLSVERPRRTTRPLLAETIGS